MTVCHEEHLSALTSNGVWIDFDVSVADRLDVDPEHRSEGAVYKAVVLPAIRTSLQQLIGTLNAGQVIGADRESLALRLADRATQRLRQYSVVLAGVIVDRVIRYLVILPAPIPEKSGPVPEKAEKLPALKEPAAATYPADPGDVVLNAFYIWPMARAQQDEARIRQRLSEHPDAEQRKKLLAALREIIRREADLQVMFWNATRF